MLFNFNQFKFESITGSSAIVRYLAQHGADLSASNQMGENGLHYSSSRGILIHQLELENGTAVYLMHLNNANKFSINLKNVYRFQQYRKFSHSNWFIRCECEEQTRWNGVLSINRTRYIYISKNVFRRFILLSVMIGDKWRVEKWTNLKKKISQSMIKSFII